MKVLYVASEGLPFIASGGLADVAGSLPQALRQRLIGARIVMPLYDDIPQELRDSLKFVTSLTVPVAWRRQYCGVFEGKYAGVIYYFIDNQYYFKRRGLYGHYDDAERFAFFSRAVLEMLPHIGFKPNIIHCNDWQSALTPVYYDLFYSHREEYAGIKTLFTIHNIQYQGKYGIELINDVLGIPATETKLLEYDGCVNMMKGAIETAHAVSTVSQTYSYEILDPWFSHGLDGILKERQWKLSGILNGIDVINYNPETDENIYQTFSIDDMSGKAVNKAKLQERMGLPVRADVPVIGIVTRLVAHKGLDLIKETFNELLSTSDVQVIALGSGDWQYESFFREMCEKYPEKIAVGFGFVPELARKIYASSDIFLMPSKSEPCGLAQMVALRYGTIPVVRETGGLKDSISDSGDGIGNGFTFKSYDAGDMLTAINRALEGYSKADGWKVLVKRAMESDNSWGRSANEYIRLYKSMLAE